MAATYTAITMGLGDMDVGCLVEIPEIEGLTSTEHTTTVAIFIRRDRGVRTCSLHRNKVGNCFSSKIKVGVVGTPLVGEERVCIPYESKVVPDSGMRRIQR
jgi:hypothetical protein